MRDLIPSLLCVLLLAAGCASAGVEADGGFVGSPDARVAPGVDSSLPLSDALVVDARLDLADASASDASVSDASVSDASVSDASVSDALVSDASVSDAPVSDAAAPVDSAILGYSHTITIDGINDFDTGNEAFTTTSGGYTAYVSWDATHIYIGYAGADMAAADTKKWLQIFFDTDPGAATGAVVGEQYNTQRPGMPTGFGAEFYYRWRSSNDFQNLQQYVTATWQPVTTTISTFQNSEYVEIAILRSALGDPAKLGITALMLNETNLAEGAYAGLYSGSFTDGYFDVASANIPIGFYLEADFASAAAPNAAVNRRP